MNDTHSGHVAFPKPDPKFCDLESYRLEQISTWGSRDGYTPNQRCAIALAVQGLRMEMLILAGKDTLRVLFLAGLIDYMGHATWKAEELFWKWAEEDRKKPIPEPTK